MKTCTVDGCDRAAPRRLMCEAHYFRVRRNGHPGPPEIQVRRGYPHFIGHVGCRVEGCGRRHKSNGYCLLHYTRWSRHGDPLMVKEPRRVRRPLVGLFLQHVDKSGDCWEWTGYVGAEGYGLSWDGKDRDRSHRVAYALFVGPIPPGQQVDHRCHNAACVNPAHLRLATNKQNAENRRGAQSNSKSGVRGVRRTRYGKWETRVTHHGKRYSAGNHDRMEDAERAVKELRNRLFTHNDRDRAEEVS